MKAASEPAGELAASLTGPHWKFSLRLYRRSGVAESCLVLQDSCGVDVNVLLIALYVASRGSGVCDRSWLRKADDSVAELRERAIVPLRQARRAMKGVSVAPNLTESIRKRVKRLELETEQLEQALLARLVPEPGSQPADFAAAIANVLDLYSPPDQLQNLDQDSPVSRSIRTIAAAASDCGA